MVHSTELQAIIYATPALAFRPLRPSARFGLLPALFVRAFLIDIPLSRDWLQLKYLGDNRGKSMALSRCRVMSWDNVCANHISDWKPVDQVLLSHVAHLDAFGIWNRHQQSCWWAFVLIIILESNVFANCWLARTKVKACYYLIVKRVGISQRWASSRPSPGKEGYVIFRLCLLHWQLHKKQQAKMNGQTFFFKDWLAHSAFISSVSSGFGGNGGYAPGAQSC